VSLCPTRDVSWCRCNIAGTSEDKGGCKKNHFPSEAPFIGPPGVLKGPASIKKAMAGRFSAGWTTETIKINEAHMVGDAVWAVGEFQFSGSGEQAGKQQSGHFGEVLAKDGADWHIVMLLAAPSAAPPPPK
jgi:ketosteroid isomerase-like protein